METLSAFTCDLTTRLQQCLIIIIIIIYYYYYYYARDDAIKQLERVQRIEARVVCKKYTNDHSNVTELLWGLHWLPITARVQYKILLLVYKALNTGTPPYLAALLT